MPAERHGAGRQGLSPGSLVALAATVGALAFPAGLAIGQNSARADIVQAQARISDLEEQVAAGVGSVGASVDEPMGGGSEAMGEPTGGGSEAVDEPTGRGSEGQDESAGGVLREDTLRLVKGTSWDMDQWDSFGGDHYDLKVEDYTGYVGFTDWTLTIQYLSDVAVVSEAPTAELCRRTTAYSQTSVPLEVGMPLCLRTSEGAYVGMSVVELDEGGTAPPTAVFDVTVWGEGE